MTDLTSGEQKICGRSIEIAVEVMKAVKLGIHHIDIVNLPNMGQINSR